MLAYNFCSDFIVADRRLRARTIRFLSLVHSIVCYSTRLSFSLTHILHHAYGGALDFWISSKWWFDFSWLHKLSIRIICLSGFDICQRFHVLCAYECLWLFYRFSISNKNRSRDADCVLNVEKRRLYDVYHRNKYIKNGKKEKLAFYVKPKYIGVIEQSV